MFDLHPHTTIGEDLTTALYDSRKYGLSRKIDNVVWDTDGNIRGSIAVKYSDLIFICCASVVLPEGRTTRIRYDFSVGSSNELFGDTIFRIIAERVSRFIGWYTHLKSVLPSEDYIAQAELVYTLWRRLSESQSVSFEFKKADGSVRKANGTLLDVSKYIKGTSLSGLSGGINFGIIKYYDLDSRGFRSFKPENLIGVETVEQ